VDEYTISPAGDPFHAPPHDQDHPHACLNGYVYLGYTVFDAETGAKRSSGSRRCPAAAAQIADSPAPMP